MRGCARSCLVQIVVWAAFAAAFYAYLRPAPSAVAASGVASIVAGLLAAMAVVLVTGIVEFVRERKMLVESDSGTRPVDGTWIAVSGEISTRAPLRAPISGDSVVAYAYKIVRDENWGKTRTIHTCFDGKALAPSVINTRYGPIRLLAVPAIGMSPVDVDRPRALANATEYLRAATFEKRDTATDRLDSLKREQTDDDGVFRIDKRHVEPDTVLTDHYRFEERQIRQGEMICAFGVYSQLRGGLIPDKAWERPTRVVHGTAAEGAAALRGRIVRYAVGAVILVAVAIGGIVICRGQLG